VAETAPMNAPTSEIYDKRVYTDTGNSAVIDLVDREAESVLDIGCGSGDTAALLRLRDPHKQIDGITASRAEAEAAALRLDQCWIADLERALPSALVEHPRQYDVVIFSHVLEHMRDPQRVLERVVPLLKPGGSCVIAVPNVMVYRQRWEFLRGRFEYQAAGLMDETHLRFFSYESAAKLLARAPELSIEQRRVTGNAPLWLLRRRLPAGAVARIDALACKLRPNLFGAEVLIVARKRP
jgi:2-polyprenyl-3-methyl-5-hydroxy-6-metoxy-1,4-benzoquinol methylase